MTNTAHFRGTPVLAVTTVVLPLCHPSCCRCVTIVLLLCHPLCHHCVTVVLLLCCRCVAIVLPLCHHCVAIVLPLCCHCVTIVLPLCCRCVAIVSPLCCHWAAASRVACAAACVAVGQLHVVLCVLLPTLPLCRHQAAACCAACAAACIAVVSPSGSCMLCHMCCCPRRHCVAIGQLHIVPQRTATRCDMALSLLLMPWVAVAVMWQVLWCHRGMVATGWCLHTQSDEWIKERKARLNHYHCSCCCT